MGMTGCTTSSPAPTSTPTGFATEAEAFAAAEATYRAYVDALNAVDLSDPATFEPVYEMSMGELNAVDRKSFSQMHADAWVKQGKAMVTRTQLVDWAEPIATIRACYDVSQVTLDAPNGASVVSPTRPDVQSLDIRIDNSTGKLVQIALSPEPLQC
jgi:hypothetical protein